MKCSLMTFIGCVNGEAEAANKTTQLAPNGAINMGWFMRFDKMLRPNMSIKPPTKPRIRSVIVRFWW